MRFRLVVVAAAAGLMVFGGTQLGDAPKDVYPEFTPTYVEVQTEALGLSAAEVEQFITVPLEANLLNGVAWLDTIRSESVPGLSSIVLVFEPGTDLMQARQVVQERLTQAAALPKVSKPPAMLQPVSSTSRTMVVGLASENLSLIDMGVLARWNIRPRLMGVEGVANVSVWGARERQLQVQVDPERLREASVSLDQIVETSGNALWVSPLSFLEASTPGTGGFIDGPNQRLGIRHVSPIRSAGELALVTLEGCTGGVKPPRHVDANCPPPPADPNTVVNAQTRTDGSPRLRIGDVATVVEDHQPLIGDGVVNGAPGLLLVVEKLPWANSVDVTRDVEAALEALRPGLGGVEFDTSIYRPASFIDRAVDNLTVTGLIALGLMALMLGALLFNWRTALITLVSIVLSLVAAALVLQVRDTAFNAMLFAGLVVALCAVADDAVTAVHNMARRLGGEAMDGNSRSPAGVIGEALLQARGPLLFATLVILAPLIPVILLDTLTGSLLRPLATSYALALAASMLVTLTVTPALGLLLLRSGPLEARPSPVMGWLQRRYDGTAKWFVGSTRPLLAAVGVLVLVGVAVVPWLRPSTVPTFKETDLLVEFEGAPGTSLPAMNRMTVQATEELRSVPGVRNVGAHLGRAVLSDEVVGANSGELWVSLDPDADYDATVASVRDVIAGYEGFHTDLLTYPNERIRDALAAPDDPVVVRIYGDDSDVLHNKAEEVRAALSDIDGISGARVDFPAQEPTVEIEVDLAAAERHQITPGIVRRAAATLLQGLEVGYLFEEQKVFEVIVVAAPEKRQNVTNVGDLLIDKPNGDFVRLGDVAYVNVIGAPNVIRRDAVSRHVDVAAGVSGRKVDTVVSEVKEKLAALDFPLEYHAELLGDHEERRATERRTLMLAAASAVAILFLLQAGLRSWRLAFLSFAALPLALVGGVLAALVGGREVSLGALAGFLALFAIAARSGVLLIRHYQDLQQEGEPFGVQLVLRGARERLTPILLTAGTMAAAFAPFAIRGDIAGLEIIHPMAVVILGGLVSTTLVNLFVLPALYLQFASGAEPEILDIDLYGAYSFDAATPTRQPEFVES